MVWELCLHKIINLWEGAVNKKYPEKPLSLSFKSSKGLFIYFPFINFEKDLDVLEGGVVLKLEGSILGSIMQVRSPPKIRWCIFKFGREAKSLLAKSSSSQLGAHIFTNKQVYTNSLSHIIHKGSNTTLWVDCILMLIGIANLSALVLKLKWNMWLTQAVHCLNWSGLFKCVSWRKSF